MAHHEMNCCNQVAQTSKRELEATAGKCFVRWKTLEKHKHELAADNEDKKAAIELDNECIRVLNALAGGMRS